MSRKLTYKQKMFVEAYLETLNATESARRAKYKGNENTLGVIGHENLRKPKIREEIDKRLKELAMSAEEVLARLGDMARGDIGDFLTIESMSFDLSLRKAKELGLTHLIKKVKQRTIITQKKDGDEEENHYIEIELHDSQSALEKLGRYHKLFTDKQEFVGELKVISVKDEEIDRAISTLAETIGESIPSKNGG